MNEKSKSRINIGIIVFLVLFLSVGFIVTNDLISSALTIALWLVTLLMIIATGRVKISPRVLIVVLVLIALMLVTDIARGEDLLSNAKLFFSIITMMLFASAVSFEEFSVNYVRVIKILCVISLIGYTLHLLVPDLFNLFLVLNKSQLPFSNWIIYIQYAGEGMNSFRNWGFAWEPGAFATFICLSLLLEILTPSCKVKLKSLAIYMATIITTFSTTGIVAFICLCVYLLVINKSINKKTKRNIALIVLVIVIVAFSMSSFFFDTNINSVFGKLVHLLEKPDDTDISSASIRINSITMVFQTFFEKPFLGWGYEGLIQETYDYTLGLNTCTFVNWFAVYGLFFGIMMLIGIYRLCSNLVTGTWNRLIVLIFIFGITMTENYVHCPIVFLLVIYGYGAYYQQQKATYHLENVPNNVNNWDSN